MSSADSTRTTVVELKLVDGNRIDTKARFVLLPNGAVTLVPLTFSVKDVWEVVGKQLLGPDGLVDPSHGSAYLQALRRTFQGSYFWATEPFEMDLAAALRPETPGT
jgi:hypothetical protein